jgi:hypothetical protein
MAKAKQFDYTMAVAVTKTRPALVMEADARGKKRFFVSLHEVPMTKDEARAFAARINVVFDLKKPIVVHPSK